MLEKDLVILKDIGITEIILQNMADTKIKYAAIKTKQLLQKYGFRDKGFNDCSILLRNFMVGNASNILINLMLKDFWAFSTNYYQNKNELSYIEYYNDYYEYGNS